MLLFTLLWYLERWDLIGAVMSFFAKHRTLFGMRDGVMQSMGISLAGALFAFVFGVLAEHYGLSFLQGLAITAVVYAGALQMISLHLWFAHPVPTLTLVILAVVICARYILMGMVLRQKLAGTRALWAYFALFFITDETWALTIIRARRYQQKSYLYGYFLGSGLLFYMLWVVATCCGMLLGRHILHPQYLALDFAFVAIFLALLVGLWHGKADLLPWVCAAVAALLSSYWIPGSWYIVIGALVGSVCGVLRDVYAT